jgi:tetratricopeptide (TPR) repeat protein
VEQEYERALIALGRQALKNKDYATALTRFTAVLNPPENLRDAENPKNPSYKFSRIYWFLALAHDSLKQADKAREYLGKAAAEKNDPNENGYYHGLALKKLGQEKEAAAVFGDLITAGNAMTGNREAQGQYLIGLGLRGQGKNPEAAAAFKKALEKDISLYGATVQLATSDF